MRLSLLALVLLFTGCDSIIRTYGSHGNVEAHKAQMTLAVKDFEASLARNRADLTWLSRKATDDPSLARATEHMAALVSLQEAVLERQRQRLEELEETNDYRDLNNAYGAMITEQRMLADRYGELAAGVMQGKAAPASYVGSVVERARYAFVPPQYYRINNRQRAAGLSETAAPQWPEATPLAAPDPSGAALPDTVATLPARSAEAANEE